MAKRPTLDVTFGPYPLSFPNLTKPDEKYDVYTANGVDDPNSQSMKQAKAILQDAIQKFGLDPEDLKLPLTREMQKDPNAPANAKKPKKVPTGKLLLKSKSQRPPALFDAKGNPIDPRAIDPKGGTVARVQGFLAPYDMSGQEGISFTLTGVQIIKLVEGGSRAKFDAYEGEDAYEYDANGSSFGSELSIGDDNDEQAEDDAGGLDI